MDRWQKEQAEDWTPSGHHGKQHFNANPIYRVSTGGSAAPWGTDLADPNIVDSRHGNYQGKQPVHDVQSLTAAQHGMGHLTEPSLIDPEHTDPTHFHPEEYPEHTAGHDFDVAHPAPAAGYTAQRSEDDYLPYALDHSHAARDSAGASLNGSKTGSRNGGGSRNGSDDPHAEYAVLQAQKSKAAMMEASVQHLLAERGLSTAPPPLGAFPGMGPPPARAAPPAQRTSSLTHHHHMDERVEVPHHWNDLSTGSCSGAAPYATAPEEPATVRRSVVGATTDEHMEAHHFKDDQRYRPTTSASRISAPYAYDS